MAFYWWYSSNFLKQKSSHLTLLFTFSKASDVTVASHTLLEESMLKGIRTYQPKGVLR